MATSHSGSSAPRSDGTSHVDSSGIVAALERAVAVELPPALPRQRWFGDKGRAITGVRLRDCGAFGARAWLTLVDVSFAEGPDATYAVPIALDRDEPAGALSFSLDLDGTTTRAIDAFDHAGFNVELLTAWTARATEANAIGALGIMQGQRHLPRRFCGLVKVQRRRDRRAITEAPEKRVPRGSSQLWSPHSDQRPAGPIDRDPPAQRLLLDFSCEEKAVKLLCSPTLTSFRGRVLHADFPVNPGGSQPRRNSLRHGARGDGAVVARATPMRRLAAARGHGACGPDARHGADPRL